MKFFDANVCIGIPTLPIYNPAANAQDILEEMDGLKIEKAVVRHTAQYHVNPVYGNSLLSKEIAGQKRLWGCWAILPPQTDEVIKNNFFAGMKEDHIAGLLAFPERNRFLLNRVAFGTFLDEVAERKIPLFLNMGDEGLSFASLYELLDDFPALTCILCNIGIWGVSRFTWPLLEKFPRFYLESSLLSLEEGGVEATVKRFGAERILFGTGFPERYMEAPILQLLHAEITEAAKKKIASENLENIIKTANYI